MYTEVVDNADFDYLNNNIQSILTNQPRYNATSWARKSLGNGTGGYYILIPAGDYYNIPELQELLEGYPQYVTLPIVNPPNTFTPLTITDDIVYAAGDFVNFGKIVTSANISETYLLNYGGVKKIILIYRDGQVVIINTFDGSYHYINTGFFKPWKPIYLSASNDLIIICATSPDLVKINLTSNTITYTTIFGVTITSTTSGLQDRCMGSDGNVYFGTSLDARAFRYNPSTNVITALGQQYTDPFTYVYFIGADVGFTYCLIKQSGNYWFSIINNSTLSKTTIGSIADGYRSGAIVEYQDGATKFWRLVLTLSNTGLPNLTKDFVNGIEISGLSPSVSLFETEQNGYLSFNTNYPRVWPSLFNIDSDFNGIDGVYGDCEIGYKTVGDPSFTYVSFAEVLKSDVDPQTFQADLSGDLLFAFRDYGPIVKWGVSLGVLDQAHPMSSSIYSLLEFSSDKVFIGGYVNKSYEWNPSIAWDFLTNPFVIPFSVGNAYYHYFYAQSGAWLYSYQELNRNEFGSEVSMYNPTTQEVINADAAQILLLTNYGVSSMFTINGGNKLVIIGRPIKSAIYPRVFVFDISSNKNINELTPVTFDLNISGLTGGGGFPVATDTFVCFIGNVVYKVVLSPFSITYKNLPSTLVGPGFWFKSVAQKADGKIMFLGKPASDTFLYELDGVTFTAKKKSSTLGSGTNTRGLVVSGSDLYLCGGNYSVSQYMGQNSKYFLEKLTL